MSPSLENFIVLTWLRLIHSDLPKLVKQRYGTELRSRTLASIRPEISQALSSLLDEIRSADDARILRSTFTRQKPSNQYKSNTNPRLQTSYKSKKSCPLCKASNRRSDHFLSSCSFLPESDRKYMLKARQLSTFLLGATESDTEDQAEDDNQLVPYSNSNTEQHNNTAAMLPAALHEMSTSHVKVIPSPFLDVFHEHHPVRLTLDSGATGNMIKATLAHELNAKIVNTTQSAKQADGLSHLKVLGETRLTFTRDDKQFFFEGLVVEKLGVDVLAGTVFLTANDIAIRTAKCMIKLADGTTYYYNIQSGSDRLC